MIYQNFRVTIECSKVNKRYGDFCAVKDLSFSVAQNSICALLGGNGAGKTTTLSMLMGVLTPTSGRIRILGVDMATDRFRALPFINFTSPYVDLPKRLTVHENLLVFAGLYSVHHPRQRIAKLADLCDISMLLHKPYGALSAGQRSRVSIAKALLNQPQLLLLDEPTASLDPDMGERMRTLLADYRRDTGATLLLASHNMLEVERLCDQVLMMRGGRIVDRGSPAQLRQRYGRASLEEVFIDIARDRVPDGAR